MRLEPKIIQRTKDAQQRVFRLAERDYGLTRKAISLDAGIDYDSVCNYAKGETQMGVAAQYALVGVIPDQLLSLLLPEGRSVVQVPDNIDHEAVHDWACRYSARKAAAHKHDSEEQERIGPTEEAELNGIVVQFPAVAA